MHKRQVTMIIGIMAIAAVVAVFAIIFNSTPHQSNKQATAATSTQHAKKTEHQPVHKRKKQSTVDKEAMTSQDSHKKTGFDVKAVLKDQPGVPSIYSVKLANKQLTIVFADDGTNSLESFMTAYAKATTLILKQAAAQTSDIDSVAIAQQVKLEDGTEYAVAGKWQKDQLTNTVKLATTATAKDLLLSASHYSIGGSVWDTFSQQQKNDYQNHQQGGQVQTTDDSFNQWVQAGIVKNK